MKIINKLLYSLSIILIAIGIYFFIVGSAFMWRLCFTFSFIAIYVNNLIDNIRLRKELKKKDAEIDLLIKNGEK
ncbi:MAG: hypothetical protein LBV69_00210 [Bacteroidales bacterium]|jgi:hypothetical protein|nr:hypothetical protein [Bacteroidales bacterium]